MKYKTRQKELLYQYFINHKGECITAAHLKQKLQAESIGLTTIYRCLQEFENENIIRKYTEQNTNSASYEYIEESKHCKEHYHLKCSTCGSIIHLECSNFENVTHHIKETHDFIINPLQSTLYGICKKCYITNK